MIPLIINVTGAANHRVEVCLDVAQGDTATLTSETRDLMVAASLAKRKVGCILRDYGGDTWFTYEPGNQAQLEVHLVAALAASSLVEAVSSPTGGTEWDKY